jgi:hypothetical protein
MAAPAQYGFELREVAIALIKLQGINEGRWWAVFEFVLRSGVFGQTNAELLPGGLLSRLIWLDLTCLLPSSSWWMPSRSIRRRPS